MRLDSFVVAALAIVPVMACNALPGPLNPTASKTDPNACGGFASSGDTGRKLKLFLQATNDLEHETRETLGIVKDSCILMGNELGMTDADYKGEAKDVCAAVYGKVQDGLKVAFKGEGAVKFDITPPVCRVDAHAQVEAAAQCEAKASADLKVQCTGVCHGSCDGTATDGKCAGTCSGSCEGSADVDASLQCRASASVKASVDAQCTEPSIDIQADAKLVVDQAKADQTIKALKAGLPKILAVRARLVPMSAAVKNWVASASELKKAGMTLANEFKGQAMCVSGQIAAAANAIGKIEGNLSVSVSVSASATATIGG